MPDVVARGGRGSTDGAGTGAVRASSGGVRWRDNGRVSMARDEEQARRWFETSIAALVTRTVTYDAGEWQTVDDRRSVTPGKVTRDE